METVTISPKYQISIPRQTRERLHLVPGQKLEVLAYDGRIVLVPVLPLAQLRGFLRGVKEDFQRDEEDRA